MRLIIRRIRIRKGTRRTSPRIDHTLSCSRLSALSPMRRTAIMLFALAALTATSARGTLLSTRPHRRTPGTSSLHSPHRSYRHTGTRDAHRAVPRASSNRSYASRTHPLSANEVGWRAGLAIRRQIEQRGAIRRQVAAGTVRLPTSRTYRIASNLTNGAVPVDYGSQPGYASSTPTATGRTTRAPQAALASVAMNREPAGTGMAESAGTPTYEQTQAQTAASPQDGQEIADIGSGPGGLASNGSTPLQRLALPGRAKANEPVTTGDAATTDGASASGGADDDAVPPATEATSVKAESEVMSKAEQCARKLPLRGSLESLERQNVRPDAEGLERIEDKMTRQRESQISCWCLCRPPQG